MIAPGAVEVEIVKRAALVLPEVLEEILGIQVCGREGYCVQVCQLLADVLEQCGLDAETVAVDVRCLPEGTEELLARGVPMAFWPEHAAWVTQSRSVGRFSGHTAVRVTLPPEADLELLVDLTLAQYADPGRGINPPSVLLAGWGAGEMDQGMVSYVGGRGRIDYTLRPDMDDWDGAGLAVKRVVGGGDGPVLSDADSRDYIVGVAVGRVLGPLLAGVRS